MAVVVLLHTPKRYFFLALVLIFSFWHWESPLLAGLTYTVVQLEVTYSMEH